MRRFSKSRLIHQVMLPRVPTPPALLRGLFSHRLWRLGILVLAGSVLVGCELGTFPSGLGGFPHPPSLPPPPDMIAFTTTRDGNHEIYVMNADGTNPTRLTSDPAFDASCSWSP